MRWLLVSFTLITLGSHATAYDLKDKNILGLYKLQGVDKKAEVQSAELVYNNDNVLVEASKLGIGYQTLLNMKLREAKEGSAEERIRA